MKRLFDWLQAHPRRMLFVGGALLFFGTLLFYFFAAPAKGVILSDSRRAADPSLPPIVIPGESSRPAPKTDLSVMTSRLREGKSDAQTLLYLMLAAGAGVMLYSLIKKKRP